MPSPKLLATAVLSLLIPISYAQDATTSSTIALPTIADAETDAGTDLFQFEKVQVTEEFINELKKSDDPDVARYAHLFAFNSTFSGTTPEKRARACKTTPGDALWPSTIVWNVFNRLLGNALSPIVPIASPCYGNSTYDNYNSAECASVTSGWTTEELHYSDPGSVMFPLYQGNTCPPGTDPSQLQTCTQGGYSSYSIRVSNVGQIQLAVNFARDSNIRLVIKNTGHDYNGRSTGKYALSLWTHNLKDIDFIPNYRSRDYQGPVMKIGAGVQVHELYQAAEANGVSAVGGICPTVGVAGGYITGGGHGPLMPLFGMGADQVVALEVVTASGRFLTATPTVNSDLYWAMLGGGGGTFGIVTSAIIKAHPRIPVTTSKFSFSVSPTVSEELFWKGFQAVFDLFPAWNVAKTYSYFSLFNTTGAMALSMDPFFAPNKTVAEFEELVAPLFANLTALGIPYTIQTKYHPSFLEAYDATFLLADQNIGSTFALPGTRMLHRDNWNNATIRARTVEAVKTAIRNGIGVLMYHQAPANPAQIINSVNPALRTEASMLIALSPLAFIPAQLGDAARALTNNVLGPLRDVSPNSGTYGNEADVNEPNWQQAFWGENYPRLLRIKRAWDPTGLFYVHHGVGSEDWEVRDGVKWGGVPTQDGLLCRV